MASFLTTLKPGLYNLAVHAKPGARTSAFAAPLHVTDDAIEVRVAAPPVEGQANAELVDFMQSTLDLYVRQMQTAVSSSDSKGGDALATFLEGTAYRELTLKNASATEKSNSAAEGADSGSKRAKGKGKAKGAASDGGGSKGKASDGGQQEPLPEKVHVSLSRGSTSRSKVLEVAFPGSDIELACLLQLASRDAK